MKKRFMSAFLAVIMLFSMLSTTAFAASSEEEALGEINIFNGGVTMSYLSINGRIREQIYTYYNRVTPSGAVKEIPAYCVNPNDKGVPQTVGVGESIKYLADEKAADPKVTGIIANGYPNRGLSELGLENKYHAYYATKMALWCYLLSHWDINNLKVNPNLTGLELERAQKILAAAKDIYRRGTTWTENLSPNVRCTPDRDVAYEVTVNGRQYKQQVFKTAELGVSITKRGNAAVLAGNQMRYDITVANTSNVDLESFYWHDRIPTDVARATTLTTGTYSARLNYRILYKTNYTANYQVLASNLLTSNNYSFALNAIPMQAGEVITDIYFDFGKVPVGFQSVSNPTLSVMVNGNAVNGYYMTNRADVGGKYLGTWQTANASWVTIIQRYGTTLTLPKTGY